MGNDAQILQQVWGEAMRKAYGYKQEWIRRFYNSVGWRKKRAYILLRDGYMCQHCKAKGKVTPANEVHHIRELKDYKHIALVDSNLISLCRECHEATKDYSKKIELPEGVRIIKA